MSNRRKNKRANLDVDNEVDDNEVDDNEVDDNDTMIVESSVDIMKIYIYQICTGAFSVSKIYLFWICLHYASVHLYVYFCAPASFTGFILSPFQIALPHCRALRWASQNGADVVNSMWVVFGTWLCSKVVKPS